MLCGISGRQRKARSLSISHVCSQEAVTDSHPARPETCGATIIPGSRRGVPRCGRCTSIGSVPTFERCFLARCDANDHRRGGRDPGSNLGWLVPAAALMALFVFPMPGRGPNSSRRHVWRGFKFVPRRAVLARAGERCEAGAFIARGRCSSPAVEGGSRVSVVELPRAPALSERRTQGVRASEPRRCRSDAQAERFGEGGFGVVSDP